MRSQFDPLTPGRRRALLTLVIGACGGIARATTPDSVRSLTVIGPGYPGSKPPGPGGFKPPAPPPPSVSRSTVRVTRCVREYGAGWYQQDVWAKLDATCTLAKGETPLRYRVEWSWQNYQSKTWTQDSGWAVLRAASFSATSARFQRPPFAAWVKGAVVIVEVRLADGRTTTIRSAASGVW